MIFLRRAAACFILPHRKRAWRTPRRYGAPAPLSLARFHPGHRRATFPARRADTMRWSTIKATVCHAPARRGALRHGRERALMRSRQALSTMIVVPQIGLPLLLV